MKTLVEELKSLAKGDKVTIHSGYTSGKIGDGEVVKVCKNWVEVKTPMYRRSVRYRTSVNLTGIRIVGGLAEVLNDRIRKAG